MNLISPPEFQGLRDDLPVRIYERNLPHWRQTGATYFVTFRLNDALPSKLLALLRDMRRDWEARNPPPRSREKGLELSQLLGKEAEQWLDAGMGSCLLRDPANRTILEQALHYFDLEFRDSARRRCELGAYVAMPNHVHLIVRPQCERGTNCELESLLHSWKRHSSRAINHRRGHEGSIWFEESYDRIIRDAGHLWRCLQYIGRNPAQARLAHGDYSRWVRPEWEDLGWRFED